MQAFGRGEEAARAQFENGPQEAHLNAQEKGLGRRQFQGLNGLALSPELHLEVGLHQSTQMWCQMFFAVLACLHCLGHSLQTDPFHCFQGGHLQVFADESPNGLIGGDGEGIGEVGHWCFLGNIVFVLAGVSVVIVMQEWHENGGHILGGRVVHVSLKHCFEKADEGRFNQFEPCKCKSKTPLQKYLIEMPYLCLLLQLFRHALNVLFDIAEGSLHFSLIFEIDGTAIDVEQPVEGLTAERVTELVHYYLKRTVSHLSVP